MPISGLVVILHEDEPLREEAIRAIKQDPRLAVGPARSNRLALVVDTPSSHEDREVWDRLQSLPGVALVELAFVGFEPSEPSGSAGSASAATPQPVRTPPPDTK